MVATNQDGARAAGGTAGYAPVREYASALKPEALSFAEAGVLGVCFLSAHLALVDHAGPGDSFYILGGGGGVGHLAIQKAARHTHDHQQRQRRGVTRVGEGLRHHPCFRLPKG